MNTIQALNILKPQGNTPEDIKKAYRQGCKKYHPDVNPNGLELMKIINAAYDFLKKNINKWTFGQANNDVSIDQAITEIFDKIKHVPGIEPEVCGSWLWVSGETKPYKDLFKELGLKWARNKAAWYWRPDGYRKRSKKRFSMPEIRVMFGSQELETEALQQVG